MAITDVPAFAHLTDADIENLAFELDTIRQDIEDSLGERDSRYIRRTIAAQRALEVAGRLMLAASSKRSAWWAGTLTLAASKIIENMEIGHNVMHGQWDWMNDPQISSSTWDWDSASTAEAFTSFGRTIGSALLLGGPTGFGRARRDAIHPLVAADF
jgi:linoleoyl-CoA desaturase